MKLINLILFASLLFIGCKSFIKQVQENEIIELNSLNLLSIENDCSTKKLFNIESIFDSIHFIPLETRTDVLLDSNIKGIQMCRDFFIILDRQALYVFDKKGRFCNKIGQQGKGAGEYWEITNFYVNENSEVVILDLSLGKFLVYSLRGQFKRTKDIQSILYSYVKGKKNSKRIYQIYVPNDSLLFCCHFMNSENPDFYSLYNANTEQYKSLTHNWKGNDLLFTNVACIVSLNGHRLLCVEPYSNIVSRLDADSLIPVYRVNPRSGREFYGNWQERNAKIVEETIKNKQYSQIYKLFESENNVYMLCFEGMLGTGFFLIWNKNTQEGIYHSMIKSDLLWAGIDYMQDNDICLATKNVSSLKALYQTMKSNNEDIPSYLEKLNQELDDDANPVLVVKYIKKVWGKKDVKIEDFE